MDQTPVEKINEMANLGFKVAIGIGVVVLFCYLRFQANFMPSGIAIGDSLLFIFICLAFGIQYLLWIAIGYFIIFGGSIVFKRKGENRDINKDGQTDTAQTKTRSFFDRAEPLIDAVGIFLLVFVALISLISIGYFAHDIIAAVAPLVGGLFLWIGIHNWKILVNSSEEEKLKRKRQRKILILAGLWSGIVSISTVSLFTTGSMRSLGLYEDKASLKLSEENYQLVEGVANQAGMVILGCADPDGKSRIIHGFRVWWHGIGDRSFIELLPRTPNTPSIARIELKRDGLNVIRWTSATMKHETCLTLPTDSSFNSNEATLNSLGAKKMIEIKEKLSGFVTEKLKIKKITIIGHSDRTPVLKKGDSNLNLSARRAAAVEKELSSYAEKLDSFGVGATEPKVNCPNSGDKVEMDECLMPNRRVEIRVEISESE